MFCIPALPSKSSSSEWLGLPVFKKKQDLETITDVKQKLRKSIFAPASSLRKTSCDKPVSLVNRETIALHKAQSQQQERVKLERKAKLLERKLKEVEDKLRMLKTEDLISGSTLTDEQFIASVKAVINTRADDSSTPRSSRSNSR